MRRTGLGVIGALVLWAAASVGHGATTGATAPDFKLKDETGKEHSLSQYKGKFVVLEWTNQGCPFVVTHYEKKTMQKLSGEYGPKGVVWLAINSTHDNKPSETVAWMKKHDFEYHTLQDNDGTVGKAYGATNTPHMYIVDKDGKLAYQGAIDNDPGDNDPRRTNYVDAGLKSLMAGAKLANAETKAYGCSVKYK